MIVTQPLSRTDLAHLADVTPETLRHWQAAGLIPEPQRVSARRVEFTPADALVVLAVAKARGH